MEICSIICSWTGAGEVVAAREKSLVGQTRSYQGEVVIKSRSAHPFKRSGTLSAGKDPTFNRMVADRPLWFDTRLL
jgi:hypothetical protein